MNVKNARIEISALPGGYEKQRKETSVSLPVLRLSVL